MSIIADIFASRRHLGGVPAGLIIEARAAKALGLSLVLNGGMLQYPDGRAFELFDALGAGWEISTPQIDAGASGMVYAGPDEARELLNIKKSEDLNARMGWAVGNMAASLAPMLAFYYLDAAGRGLLSTQEARMIAACLRAGCWVRPSDAAGGATITLASGEVTSAHQIINGDMRGVWRYVLTRQLELAKAEVDRARQRLAVLEIAKDLVQSVADIPSNLDPFKLPNFGPVLMIGLAVVAAPFVLPALIGAKKAAS